MCGMLRRCRQQLQRNAARMDKRKSQCSSLDAGFCCDGLGAEIAGTDFEVSEGFSSLSLSLFVFLPPTSVAIIITSNNPLWAISKTFTPVMWLQ